MFARADGIGEMPEDVRRRVAIQLERLGGINTRTIGDFGDEIVNSHPLVDSPKGLCHRYIESGGTGLQPCP